MACENVGGFHNYRWNDLLHAQSILGRKYLLSHMRTKKFDHIYCENYVKDQEL